MATPSTSPKRPLCSGAKLCLPSPAQRGPRPPLPTPRPARRPKVKMRAPHQTNTAAGDIPRRLFFYNAGFLRQPRLRRILHLAGHDLRLGLPSAGDGVVVWGHSPYAARGEAVAARRGVPLVRLEDSFLRSIRPGRMGDAPLGLLVDGQGVHFNSTRPSMIETLLAKHPLDDSNLLQRARDGIDRIRSLDLSKYNLHDETPPPVPVSPWRLLGGAIAVYAVSSQLGFEAILAGHRPRLFGQPFYAGWGLSEDEFPIDRRQRRVTKAQLFAAAMILAPTWYAPCRDRLCSFEQSVDQLEAMVRAHREDRAGHVAYGMRLWKRQRLQAVFGQEKDR